MLKPDYSVLHNLDHRRAGIATYKRNISFPPGSLSLEGQTIQRLAPHGTMNIMVRIRPHIHRRATISPICDDKLIIGAVLSALSRVRMQIITHGTFSDVKWGSTSGGKSDRS